MNIHIRLIPESEQRACVSGADWFWDEQGDLQVRVSPLGNWQEEMLLAFHEAIEAVLCKHDGVTQEQVDAFDIAYDSAHATDIAAGDDLAAPYNKQHRIASAIECYLARFLGVDWLEYNKRIEALYPGPSKKPTQ